jgi:hypothetical protein
VANLLEVTALGITAVVIVVLVVFYAHILRRGRRIGTRGIIQRSQLTCPKCHREFDFDWFPGGSVTALRLGKARYMACPLCHRWSTFNIYDTMVARPPPEPSGPTPRSPPGNS